MRKKDLPMAAGHECSGYIIWKGKNVNPLFEIGMQVSNFINSCGVCYECRTGNQDLCTGKVSEDGPNADFRIIWLSTSVA
jgi:D-arabinose 1-dehydrogenase-like Zn-dependent alcohol dehydrogenase